MQVKWVSLTAVNKIKVVLLAVLFSVFTSGSLSLAQQDRVKVEEAFVKLAEQYQNIESSAIIERGSLISYEEVVVKWGDTLTSIASEHGVSVQVILQTNNLISTSIRVDDIQKYLVLNRPFRKKMFFVMFLRVLRMICIRSKMSKTLFKQNQLLQLLICLKN